MMRLATFFLLLLYYLPPAAKLQNWGAWRQTLSLSLSRTRPPDSDFNSYCIVAASTSTTFRKKYNSYRVSTQLILFISKISDGRVYRKEKQKFLDL